MSEKQKRQNAVDFARGSVRYEGFVLCPETELLFQQYINEEIANHKLNALIIDLATNASTKIDEGALAANRIRELAENPIQGNFDEAHLCETHWRIFQDMPHHKPGQYRPPEPEGMIRYKNRALEDGTMPYHVWYATRNEIDSSLAKTLSTFSSIKELTELDKEQFAEELAKLYAALDYYHPFSEGNSRTLRSFTQQLAMAAGFDLDWNAKDANRKLRDELYVARDREVTEKRFPGLRNGDFSEDTQRTFMMLYKQKREVRSLQQIIADATRKISS
ncbi:Fic family protein [Oxalobacter sp. OttesenSCG-928-P03]|nr:Fic family protein [Oxalobacter sp. OttesenSCG-928-P03]